MLLRYRPITAAECIRAARCASLSPGNLSAQRHRPNAINTNVLFYFLFLFMNSQQQQLSAPSHSLMQPTKKSTRCRYLFTFATRPRWPRRCVYIYIYIHLWESRLCGLHINLLFFTLIEFEHLAFAWTETNTKCVLSFARSFLCWANSRRNLCIADEYDNAGNR